MGIVYKKALDFKRRYPLTVCWRLKKNADVIERHLHSDEKVRYVFVAQKSKSSLDVFGTAVVAITNKRILIGRKRVVYGYLFDSITPDMFNDLKIFGGVIWGRIFIDTVKEYVILSNIDKSALREIEEEISTFIMEEKKKYAKKDEQED